MQENQHLECKEVWRDDYLKWICAFANAEGGVLAIGKNDRGHISGLTNARKLLEDLPNKIRDVLGLMIPVNLRIENEKEWLEIVIAKSLYPVSYKGEYHIRIGSTRQELKGVALDQFLLRRQGRHWDAVPLPGISLEHLNIDSINQFRQRALKSGRISQEMLSANTFDLLHKLRLYEGSYLKRAAVLLFHPEPTTFISGAFVKLGFFHSISDLVYHDEITGDLFHQVHKTIELLYTKYLKAIVQYEGIQRVEIFPVPMAALREGLLNGLVHKDYAAPSPMQIRVYEDRLSLWNPAILPQGWTVEKLLGEHASLPFNPDIANAFFRAGEIEAWGRGVHRIFQACLDAKSPAPMLRFDLNELWLDFPFSEDYLKALNLANNKPALKKTSVKKSLKTSVKKSPKTSVKKSPKTSVKKSPKTTIILLELLQKKPHLTLAEAALALNRTLRAIEMASSKLVKAGRLQYIGPQRGGRWEVIE